jgi:RNA polymerase sigma-70 factor (ECF subfamily)
LKVGGPFEGRGVADRDVREFGDWVALAEPRLRGAYAGVRGPDDARDALAEALAYAWEHWERVSAMDNAIGYVFRVGQSRTRPRKHPNLPDAEVVGPPDLDAGLVPALRQLPEQQRTAVWLVHACDWSHAEAAQAMGITPSTVSTHVTRALAALRHRLEVSADA